MFHSPQSKIILRIKVNPSATYLESCNNEMKRKSLVSNRMRVCEELSARLQMLSAKIPLNKSGIFKQHGPEKYYKLGFERSVLARETIINVYSLEQLNLEVAAGEAVELSAETEHLR